MQEIILNSEKETIELGKKIAENLKIGDVFVLTGDLGSGKTKLTEGILTYYGLQNEISSPTFTIVNEYESLLEYENNMLEILLIVLGLAFVVYSFFIAFNKPIWGLVHSTVPFVCFFPLPVILKTTKIIDNDIIIAVLTIVSGIAFYSIFLILAVVIPNKRIKAATDLYIKQFEMENKGYKYSKFNGALHNSYRVSTWFYNRNNGKTLMIFTDNDTNYIVITSNLRYGKCLLKYVPIVFEKNVEVNKNIIQKIMDE